MSKCIVRYYCPEATPRELKGYVNTERLGDKKEKRKKKHKLQVLEPSSQTVFHKADNLRPVVASKFGGWQGKATG